MATTHLYIPGQIGPGVTTGSFLLLRLAGSKPTSSGRAEPVITTIRHVRPPALGEGCSGAVENPIRCVFFDLFRENLDCETFYSMTQMSTIYTFSQLGQVDTTARQEPLLKMQKATAGSISCKSPLKSTVKSSKCFDPRCNKWFLLIPSPSTKISQIRSN